MTKDRAAKIVTAVVIVLALGIVVARRQNFSWQRAVAASSTASSITPQDSIYAMLDAARAGDAKAYLSRYTGAMQANLQQAAAEKGDAGFRSYLQSSNAEIKGVAVEEPKQMSDSEVQVRVEYVYQDRNEAQIMYLEKQTGDWKIARVDSAERVKTLVPYGTPVQ